RYAAPARVGDEGAPEVVEPDPREARPPARSAKHLPDVLPGLVRLRIGEDASRALDGAGEGLERCHDAGREVDRPRLLGLGVLRGKADDEARLARATALLDDLYAFFRARGTDHRPQSGVYSKAGLGSSGAAPPSPSARMT